MRGQSKTISRRLSHTSAANRASLPQPFAGTETINDKDGLVSNFWRPVQAEPDAVAGHADWPVNENDLHAHE